MHLKRSDLGPSLRNSLIEESGTIRERSVEELAQDWVVQGECRDQRHKGAPSERTGKGFERVMPLRVTVK